MLFDRAGVATLLGPAILDVADGAGEQLVPVLVGRELPLRGELLGIRLGRPGERARRPRP